MPAALKVKPAEMTTYLQVSVMAQAAVLLLAVLQFAWPEGKNWDKISNLSDVTAKSALGLLPVVTALLIPKSRPLPFAVVGASIWLASLGVHAIADETKTDRPSKATKALAESLTTLGSATLVGALVAYMKTMRLN